jgi:hypothetical protein
VKALASVLVMAGCMCLASPVAAASSRDSVSTLGRLVVRVHTHPRCDLDVTIRRDGAVIKTGELAWDEPEKPEEVSFDGLLPGTYVVEAKAVRRRPSEYGRFRYWKGTATRSVRVHESKDEKRQRTTLNLRWVYVGEGEYTM